MWTYHSLIPILIAAAALAQPPAPPAPGKPPTAANAPAPPTPKDDKVRANGCTVDRSEARERYPTLSEFLRLTAIQDAEEVFSDPQDAIRYFMRENRGQASSDIRARLRDEIRAFRKEYPANGGCRQAAWWALGAVSGGAEYIERTANAVETL